MGKDLADKTVSKQRWQGVRVWALGMSKEGHSTRGSRRAKAACLISEHRSLQMKSPPNVTDKMTLKSEVLLLQGQVLGLKPLRPSEWHLGSGLDYICFAVWVHALVSGLKARFPRREGASVLQHSLRSALNPAKYLAYQLCFARGKFRQTCLFPKDTYYGVWLIWACPLRGCWQQQCRW